jgi:hypothetical protein
MRSSAKPRRAAKKLTPEVQRTLCEWLAAGQTKKDAASAAGISVGTLDDWLALAEMGGHPDLTDFASAIAAAQERSHVGRDDALARALIERRASEIHRDRELADRAAQLIEAGSSLRGAAKGLGVPWDALRVLVRRAGRGEEHLAALAQAAQRRARPSSRQSPASIVVTEPLTAARCT